MIASGHVSPMPLKREKTIMEIIDEGVEDSDANHVSTPLSMEQSKSPLVTPRAPQTPRSPRGQLNTQLAQDRSLGKPKLGGNSLANQNRENNFKPGSFGKFCKYNCIAIK